VLTDFQTGGRGRLARRSWIAEAGKNLLFTLVLRTRPADVGTGSTVLRLPLLAGLALALAAEDLYGLPARIKWPNDLLVGGKKLSGVLCEALAEGGTLGVLIGMGVNCNQLSFPSELGSRATSLALALGREVDRTGLLEAVLRELRGCLDDGRWHAKVLARLHGLGRRAILLGTADRESGDRPDAGQAGLILGLNPDGSLLFRPDGGEPSGVYGGEFRYESGEEA
jgi:BirA family biotin operon repressor/biotin-[acetyl-CoA-carboxylase] ligase